MSLQCIVLIVGCTALAAGLAIERAHPRGMKCPQRVDPSMWGIWIDGRDSEKGPNAYGEDYGAKVMKGLQMVYDTPAGQKIDAHIFVKIKDILGMSVAGASLPPTLTGEVGPCQKGALPAKRRKEILSTVSVPVTPLGKAKYTRRNVTKTIGALLEDYSKAVESNPLVDQALTALAVLMQNLAYLHPLADKNARSRLLLMQYALRQQGIACGTMMFNNNKNIYFDTALELANKIKEGISVYNKAFKTGFAVNPWASRDGLNPTKSHCEKFGHAWDARLASCWRHHIHKGAAGTSPLRELDDAPKSNASGNDPGDAVESTAKQWQCGSSLFAMPPW